LNPIKIVDPDGREDVIFVRNQKPAYEKFESQAMVYPDGTFDSIGFKAMMIYAGIKERLGSSLTKKDVERFLGDADRVFDDFSTLPNDPYSQGTAATGQMYNYERRDFITSSGNEMKGFVVYDPSYGGVDVRKVPQDDNYVWGMNPSNASFVVQGVHIHKSAGGSPDFPGYDTMSRGCLVQHGFLGKNGMFNYLKHEDRSSGRAMIFR
jgi:hypothetical protein